MPYFALKIWRYAESPYLCNVFFIVLDLRLTKVGARRCSFFYVHKPGFTTRHVHFCFRAHLHHVSFHSDNPIRSRQRILFHYIPQQP